VGLGRGTAFGRGFGKDRYVRLREIVLMSCGWSGTRTKKMRQGMSFAGVELAGIVLVGCGMRWAGMRTELRQE